jgi:HlyD family secretion protein
MPSYFWKRALSASFHKYACIAVGFALAACDRAAEPVAPLYDTATLEIADIEVTVEAAGVIEPETTVEVKSKASGEILTVHAETGDIVEAGMLLVEVEKRTPRNRLAEAEAGLIAAQARRNIARTQMERGETLFESGTLTQADFEQTQLEYANAEAQVVSSEVAVENARISMDDTDVRAPITGTIIEKAVEPGMVISSPTQAVSGGSVLMKMADLTAVQVRTLVDETDIGKIVPAMRTRVTVAAYPNQPFDGEVLKIEPQAIVESNVTRFAVLIALENRRGLLKPGMNAEVEIEIAARRGVPAVPAAALRTDGDIPSTAAMLGLTEGELRTLLDRGQSVTAPGWPSGAPAPGGTARSRPRGAEDDDTIDYEFGGDYWVVLLRDGEPVPVPVRAGLTDLAYTEIIKGLEPGDEVLLLPSSSLYEQQARLQQFISNRFSRGPFQQPTRGRRFR